jgi:exonuclease III
VRLRDPPGMELIAIEFDCGRQRTILASVYRTGNIQSEKDIFIDSLSNWISELGSSCKNLILVGDLNFDVLTPTDFPLTDICNDFQLTQWINCPTHKQRAIDLLFNGSDINLL